LNAPLQSIRSAPAADVEDSQQKCSNLMEWGGQAKSVPARGAGAVRECSTGRLERYEHAWRYEERRDVRPMPREHCKNTLILCGAVQEPVRPDARESYPMGQGRTWRPLDAAAQRHR